MTGEEIRLLYEKELAFFGAVTASLSHEINNAVAIVSELAGLLDDLLYAADQGRPLDEGKLKDLSNKLAKQAKKGQEIIKRLNRFAHSVDEPVKQINLKELLLQISTIAERFAFLKNVALETNFPDGAVAVENNPFILQQAVFLCIELALSGAQKDDVIEISFEDQRAEIKVFFSGPPVTVAGETAERTAILSILMKELGGTFDIAPAHGAQYSIALSIPHSQPER